MDAPLKEQPPVVPTCAEHGAGEAWLVCVHATPENSTPVKLDHPRVAGEILCADCKRQTSARDLDIRWACGACVRARWPLPKSEVS
jgi:hypothetical protein